ncbi:MAG: archaellin/type IV pilin N-terminal domain-containing protein [Candidatus Geothermarchaeales archaeon]
MKEMKKLDRRGVSPVIATILLILISIAAGVIIYTYTITFLGTSSPASAQGELVIDVAEIDTSGNGTIFFRNVGGVPLTITVATGTNLFANNLADGSLADATLASCPTSLAVGASGSCTFDADPFTPGAGEDVVLKLVVDDGTTASLTVSAHA